MTQQEILESRETKTWKIKKLLELGLTRREVSNILQVGYGFVQNVFAETYPDRVRTRRASEVRILDVPLQQANFEFTFNHKFGVEIESYGVEKPRLILELRRVGIQVQDSGYTHNTTNHWKIVSDSSISGLDTFELVSPILYGEDGLNQIIKVSKVLKQLNAKINKSCGLHIHFDASGFDFKTWKNLIYNYAKLELEIDSFMPESRRRNNSSYCKSMRDSTLESKLNLARDLRDLDRIVNGNDRYKKVNLQSYWRHNTVEFRQHSGTIEFEKINNWILFLARFIEFSKQKRVETESFESIKQFLNEELIEYFSNRKTRLS